MSGLKERLERVMGRVREAAIRAGRDPSEVKLLPVSKGHPAGAILEAWGLGLREFGENYVQEAASKAEALEKAGARPCFHMIGHLQRNKARPAARLFQMVQTVDSERLARALSKAAEEAGRRLPVLIQVNVSRDPGKSGVAPEEVRGLLETVLALPGLEPRGLMTIPRWDPDPEASRPWFKALRVLLSELQAGYPEARGLKELSMGMSRDLEIAVEEGATIVRVGEAVFGPRTKSKEASHV